MKIDLNADVAEGFAFDEPLMGIVSSANICAGLHAGGVADMMKTLAYARDNKVNIGIHPSYDDRENFGRTNHTLPAEEVRALMFYQMAAVTSVCRLFDLTPSYVKPHGALYNQASTDATLALTIAQAVYEFNPKLALMGLSGGELIRAGEAAGLRTISEVFADRRYNPDGTLVSRSLDYALITDEAQAVAQVLRMVKNKEVVAVDGSVISLAVDSICLHGDGEHALAFAKKIKEVLMENGIAIG
ncbi:MAG: 5-oxoprolinase subunit PxpA [Moraxella sp.]|nr:5-oxoprolinase subunit PxpA [Moraxella sp.]